MTGENKKSGEKFFRSVKTFVLRQGRMSPSQKKSLVRLSPKFCIEPNDAADFEKIFARKAETVVEIGFGMGQATAEIALKNPEKNCLAFEVHTPGVASLLRLIEKNSIENIRIAQADALEAIARFSDQSVSAFHAFFPDPWPKKRHHKRRLFLRPNTDLLCQKLKPGGYVAMATDWQEYAEFALDELSQTSGLENVFQGFAPRQQWRPVTKFEQKGIDAGRRIFDIVFKKI